MNSFKYIIRSTYEQLLEFHSSALSADANGFVALADSILRLVFVQLCTIFGLIAAVLPLCKVAIFIVCFLCNNICGIAQAHGDRLMSASRMLVFACQTACLYAITRYGIVHFLYLILSAILEVTESCLKTFGR